MNTYSTTDIPTLEEVTAYFTDRGLHHNYASLWYRQMTAKKWKSATGKRIFSWQRYAGFKVNDLLEEQGKLKVQPSYNKLLLDLAAGVEQIFINKTKKVVLDYSKLIFELVSVYKVKHDLTDVQAVQAVHSVLKKVFVLEDTVGFDYNNLYSHLENSLFNNE